MAGLLNLLILLSPGKGLFSDVFGVLADLPLNANIPDFFKNLWRMP